jgi:hypothetical protein
LKGGTTAANRKIIRARVAQISGIHPLQRHTAAVRDSAVAYLAHLVFYYVAVVHNFVALEDVIVILVVVAVVVDAAPSGVFLFSKLLGLGFIVNLQV